MTDQELRALIDSLKALPKESEWVEFKENNFFPQEIGEYISALSNSARLHNQSLGYIVWGIKNGTHDVVGTTFDPGTAKGKGNEPLESWLTRHLKPSIDFRIYKVEYEPGINVVIFEIDPTSEKPLAFKEIAYIRVGETKKKLDDIPAKKDRLEYMLTGTDWSSEICQDASIDDLDSEAVKKAREQYAQKHPRLAEEMESWDAATFLNKAKLTIDGKITRATIILLGKDESSHFLSPAVAQISWILNDADGESKDYEHFSAPLILKVDKVFHKIRNLTLRTMPDGTLFPKEITQYDNWVIREALHNAIAHQDYSLKSRINLLEKPDELLITNKGSFIPGSIEEVIKPDAAPSYYRNAFLANAMVNLNMIDTIGSGIRRMFTRQRERFFPLPDFDLSQEKEVRVRISGKILNENYTQLLMKRTDMPLEKVILLDRVQKGVRISHEAAKSLRRDKLIEGRYPNIFVSFKVASVTGQMAKYIKNRSLGDLHYIELVKEFIRRQGSASRKEINDLLFDKLPDILNEKQKLHKINKIVSYQMVKKKGLIKNIGSRRASKWVLVEDE